MARAAVLCVNPAGGGCFTTIQAAINAAANGDTIVVAPGTYNENLVLGKSLTLQGAQVGVTAWNRVVGPPNPLVESVLTAGAGTTILTLTVGSAGSTIDGFAFDGANRAIESASGPLDGLTVQNNHVGGFTGTGVFLNDPGVDVTFLRNVIDGGAMTAGGGMIHLDTDGFDGFWLLENWIRNGLTATGLFSDGTRNVGISPGRGPIVSDNLVEACQTGMNLGRKSFEFALFEGNRIEGNTFDGIQGGPADSTIFDNRFVDNGRSGLALTGFGGGADATRGAQRNVITGNFFTGNGFVNGGEALFFSSSQFAGTISTNVATGNHICGNALGARYLGAETINVEQNTWGAVSGPFHAVRNPGGTGDTVVDGPGVLDFDPWTTDLTGSPCAPQITCPPDQVAICPNTTLTLSFPVIDERGQAVTVTFEVNGNLEGTDTIPAGGPPTVGTAVFTFTYTAGVNTVVATATNTSGASTSCTFTVTVPDTTPPSLTVSLPRTVLWLPLNGLVDVGLKATATDACDPDVDVFVTVYSDEDTGPAPLAPDAVVVGVAPTQGLRLRAERAPAVNNGRWYLVVVDAVDDAGNRTRDTRIAVVPYNLTTAQILAIRALATAQLGFIPSPFSGTAPTVGPAAPPGSFTLIPTTPFN